MTFGFADGSRNFRKLFFRLLKSFCFERIRLNPLFLVLETIRTSAMRVIHVHSDNRRVAENCASSLHCTALPQNQTNKCALDRRSDPPFHLATGRHLHPWIESVETAVQKVTKFVLQSPSQVRDEAKIRHHITPCMDLAILDHSLLAHFPIFIAAHFVVIPSSSEL